MRGVSKRGRRGRSPSKAYGQDNSARNFLLALRRVCAAGEGGYWKITGSSSKIYGKYGNVGYKKPFSFYRGWPGRDEKTDWIMHEYIVQRGSGMVVCHLLQSWKFNTFHLLLPPLGFALRLRIALGSAKGILYLHNEADPPIFHRDIKANNIPLGLRLMPRTIFEAFTENPHWFLELGVGNRVEIGDERIDLPNLEVLGMWMNNFTGVIPEKLGLNGKLEEPSQPYHTQVDWVHEEPNKGGLFLHDLGLQRPNKVPRDFKLIFALGRQVKNMINGFQFSVLDLNCLKSPIGGKELAHRKGALKATAQPPNYPTLFTFATVIVTHC
ncbi:hypothetical protein IFM89_037774 [Coptis chinensis]|uniref:NAC domain-containing protein n=1 Tax=Coptis chinensis TaxID=261450 RepID=A0A835IU64_9MAGN|nr:hypothetical protein IFM89_037774 [Coptis chinensis]